MIIAPELKDYFYGLGHATLDWWFHYAYRILPFIGCFDAVH